MMTRRFVPWVVGIVVVTILCLVVDMVVQQSYRQTANDPQIQLAEDMAMAFHGNQFTDETLQSSFETFVPTKTFVDIGVSVSPWIQVYDASGELIHSSATIADAQSSPHIPKSVFDAVNKSGEDRVTWQPKKGIRHAIVVTSFSGLKSGYIVAGRSLREIEKRDGTLHMIVGMGWLTSVVSIFLGALWYLGYFSSMQQIVRNPRT